MGLLSVVLLLGVPSAEAHLVESLSLAPPHHLRELSMATAAPPAALITPDMLLPQNVPEVRQPGWLVVSGRFAGAIAGATTAAITHEFGHALIAWGYGVGFRWPRPGGPDPFLPYWDLKKKDVSPAVRRNITVGGFLLSEVVSEAFVQLPIFPKSDVFLAGFLFYSVLNSVGYVAADIYMQTRFNQGAGDIRDLTAGGISRPLIYTAILGSGALTIARLLENPEYVSVSLFSPSTKPK